MSLDLFKEALENCTDAIGMSTPQGRHYYQNRAFTEMFGEIGEEPPKTLYVDHALGEEVFKTIMGGRQWNGEVKMNAKYGRTLDILLRAYANFDKDGNITSLVGVHTDITSKKMAEDALLASLNQLETTINAMPDLLFEVDRQGCIYYYHANRHDLLYVPPEIFIGNRMQDFLPPDIVKTLESALAEAAETGHHRGAVYSLPLKGDFRWFELSIAAKETPLPPDGRLILLARDITERRQAEDALLKLNTELEQRVAQRTALAEERAQKLRNLAEQLAQAEEQERHRIAHILHDDLQQILVSIQYHLHQLCKHDPDYVEKMEAMLQQAIGIASSLTAELCPTILYESGLGSALAWLARQMQEQYGLSVELDINADLPKEMTNIAALLYNAVKELLFNVVKHAGTKKAAVDLARTGENHLQIAVSDKGCGLAQTNSKTTEHGMGLFGIRERIEHYGGTILFESASGEGTRVVLSIPTTASSQPPEKAPQPPPLQTGSISARSGANGTIRVLLADDHAVVRRGIADSLKRNCDIEVIGEASDGAEAVAMTMQLNPDIVIMDISMPVMNGIAATKAICSARPGTAIIGLSMYSEADQSSSILAAGAAAYLSKTDPPANLLKTIHKVLQHR